MLNTRLAKQQLNIFCHDVLENSADWKELTLTFRSWLEDREKSPADILPLFGYFLAGGKDIDRTIPLCGFWSFYLFAARIADDIIDQEMEKWPGIGLTIQDQLPAILTLMSSANIALAKLDTNMDKFQAIARKMGECWSDAAFAQTKISYRSLDLQSYLEYMTVTTRITIATAFWAGALLHTEDSDVLDTIAEFGLNISMANELVSDCADIDPRNSKKKSDVELGIFKLPVIYVSGLTDHPKHLELTEKISSKDALATEVYQIVDEMGGISWSMSLAEKYKRRAIESLKKSEIDSENVRVLLEFLT
jgi:hypothetical protein